MVESNKTILTFNHKPMDSLILFYEFMDNEIENMMQGILDDSYELPDLNENYREFFVNNPAA